MHLISLALAGALSLPAVAAAGHDTGSTSSYDAYGRDAYDAYDAPRDHHRHGRLGASVRLGEVSADPRDGADFVDLQELFGTGHGRFTELRLRAREAPVRLRGIRIELADGRTVNRRLLRVLAPGESLAIALPPSRGIEHLVIDYGDREDRPTDRTPARLELYGVRGTAVDRPRLDDDWRDRDGRSRYGQVYRRF